MDKVLNLAATVIVQYGIFKEQTAAANSTSQGSSVVPIVNSKTFKAEGFAYRFLL